MNKSSQSFSDRIKESVKRLVDEEFDHFHAYEKEYKVSSHPIKRTFSTISRLNKLHHGRIAIEEIAQEAELPSSDVIFIIQEFNSQRLIDGIIEENSTSNEKFLILKQDTYLCQFDQDEHSIFDLHFQCEKCLRFICSDCYQSVQTDVCPYCKGNLTPVPRIFKKEDVKSLISPKSAVSSVTQYYQDQRSNISRKGVREVSNTIFEDLKQLNKRRWSLSTLKKNTRTYLDFRKQEKAIEKHSRSIIDTIATLHDIEGKNQIPLTRIAKLNRLDISLVNIILRRLVEQQLIQGFLETSGTYDNVEDDYLVLGSSKINCYMHEGEISISDSSYQCTTCFRSICSDCYFSMKEQGVDTCVYCGGQIQLH
jgi:hypothetical protein